MDEYFTAIKKGDRAAVARHLAADSSLASAKDRDGLSALLTALYHEEPEVAALILARKPPLDVFEAAAAGDLARVKELVEREGALASAYSPDGFFPLGLAAFFRRPAVVEYLLAKGADVSAQARNPMQVTALHAAVADGGHPGIARALIEAGAAVNMKQRHGWTPLHGATHSGDRATVELLLSRGADVNAANDEGKTALALAREHGHPDIARLLEATGARA